MFSNNDVKIFSELAKHYAQAANSEQNQINLTLWNQTNSLKQTKPVVNIEQICWEEFNSHPELILKCENEFLRNLEWNLRSNLFKWNYFRGDMVLDKFIGISKSFTSTGIGIDSHNEDSDPNAQSHLYIDMIPDEAAIDALKFPTLTAFPNKDKENVEAIQSIIKDIFPVKSVGVVNWAALWDRIVFYRGATPVLYDIIDRPEYTHKLMKKMTDIEMHILDYQEKLNLLETPGSPHCTYGYCEELTKNVDYNNITAKNCWVTGAAQIFSEISPAMHDEFEIEYLKPYYERFGLVNYGCCEPLDKKIDIIKKISTIRVISASPWTNVFMQAEAMGNKYVMARKPNPAFLATALEEDVVRQETKQTLEACKASNTPVMFILKDLTTVKNDFTKLTRWNEIVQDEINKF